MDDFHELQQGSRRRILKERIAKQVPERSALDGLVSTYSKEVTMKIPTMLVKSLLFEFGRHLDLSVERDAEEIQHRCEHEGLSFLTITLPTLSDALERGLENGLLTCPTHFSRNGSLPRLLGGFFRRVFARTGEPLLDPCIESILAIRQICRFFKKLKISCSPERELMAVRHYLEVEAELGLLTPSLRREDNTLDKISRIIWSQVFPEIDPIQLVCQHGPGVTADRLLSNERNRIRQWSDRAELNFPSDLHAYPNYGYAAESTGISACNNGVNFLSVRDEPSVRVVFVPKTQTAPRVIAIEPSFVQYMQQSMLHHIVPILESHALTRNSIRFTDQSRNQELARRSSVDKSLATLDLKDASDRVHFLLVSRIFEGSGILEHLEDSRSLHATLPTGQNVVLNKFASMGSALCFPVEAMVFYTLIQTCMHDQDDVRPSSSSIRHYSDLIDIYGDDIIVPVEYADVVVRKLEAYGLRVNVNKSFRHSLFRESCGGDYYNGISVKPVYARQVPPDNVQRWTPEIVMAWVSTANQFYELGMWSTAQVIRNLVEDATRIRIPRSTVSRGAGIYFTSVMYTTNLRFNPDICGYEQKRLVYQPLKQKDDIDGDAIACLNKWGINSFSINDVDTDRSNGMGRPLVTFVHSGIRTASISAGGSYLPYDVDSLFGVKPSIREISYNHGYPWRIANAVPHVLCSSARVDRKPKGGFLCLVPTTPFVEMYMTSKTLWQSWVRSTSDISKEISERILTQNSVISLEGGNPFVSPICVNRFETITKTGVVQRIHSSPLFAANSRALIGVELPTDYDGSALDFRSSVKRGVFKSKRRWVSLIS